MRLSFENRGGVLYRRTPTHLYLLPHPALRPFVAHYTLCLGTGAPPAAPLRALTLLPDASGCLVFSLNGDGLEGRMYGPTRTAVTVSNDLGIHPLRFFVEFRPGGLGAFTPIPQWELADRVLPLGDTAGALDGAVQACWRRGADLDGFVEAVDRLLCARLGDDGGFSALLARFLRDPGGPAALAEETQYSPRHLSRLFRARCGVSPKGLTQVLRINAAARRIQAGPLPLTLLAQELGYFDQSHFIHAFRAVCGVTPGEYRAGLSDFYNEPLKF